MPLLHKPKLQDRVTASATQKNSEISLSLNQTRVLSATTQVAPILMARTMTMITSSRETCIGKPMWGTPHCCTDIPRYPHDFLSRPNHSPTFPSISLVVRPLSVVSVRPHASGLRRTHPDLDAPLQTIHRTLRPPSCPFPSLCRSLLVHSSLIPLTIYIFRHIILAISFRTRVTMVTPSFSFIFLNIPLT